MSWVEAVLLIVAVIINMSTNHFLVEDSEDLAEATIVLRESGGHFTHHQTRITQYSKLTASLANQRHFCWYQR